MALRARQPLNVLIAGGGVAGLEGALALRELAGDRVRLTMLTPEPDFVYRPMRVREPFARSGARVHPLGEIAEEVGFELRPGAFRWLDPERRVVHTEGGERLAYDVLLLALGARPHPAFRHALTLDDRRLDDQLHGLVQDVEGGYTRKLAFIAPARMAWPLPLYELALMTAGRAWEMNEEVSVVLATPEPSPLGIFGAAVSSAVQRRLTDSGVRFVVASAQCGTPVEGEVSLEPGGRRLHVDRVVALPELFGPSTPGVPKRDGHGFISVDTHGQVAGLDRVFAAGDATDFPIKHGGVAAQQADAAAAAIAALAGAAVEPRGFDPVIHGILLGGARPLYLTAHFRGGRGTDSSASERPLWSPPAKIDARYLAPYLEQRDRTAHR